VLTAPGEQVEKPSNRVGLLPLTWRRLDILRSAVRHVLSDRRNILMLIEPLFGVRSRQARWELAADFLEDLRRVDAQLSQVKKKLAAAVKAAGTTLTDVFGVGPVIAGIVLGEAEDVSRFRNRDHFAAYNGTAPVEVSSGNRKVHRLSRRGNRRVNHAIHMAAITQIRHPHSQGRAYYDKKLAEGKTPKEALRALKRRVSDALFRHLRADARRAAASAKVTGPRGQAGNDTYASAAGSHPEPRLFGEATPGPELTLPPPTRIQPRKASSRARKG
jgi:transposase